MNIAVDTRSPTGTAPARGTPGPAREPAHVIRDDAEAILDRAGLASDAALVDHDDALVNAAMIAVAETKVLTIEIALAASNKLFEAAGTRSTLSEHNLDRHRRNARTHTLQWKVAIVGNHAPNGVAPPSHAWS